MTFEDRVERAREAIKAVDDLGVEPEAVRDALLGLRRELNSLLNQVRRDVGH